MQLDALALAPAVECETETAAAFLHRSDEQAVHCLSAEKQAHSALVQLLLSHLH